MTRQEQNAIIINSLAAELIDVPNVQRVITRCFDAWFRNYVRQAAPVVQPVQSEQPEQQPQEQGQAA